MVAQNQTGAAARAEGLSSRAIPGARAFGSASDPRDSKKLRTRIVCRFLATLRVRRPSQLTIPVREFLAAMPAHGAKAEAITEVVMDMSPAYIAGVQKI
jgi:hypothetical protein